MSDRRLVFGPPVECFLGHPCCRILHAQDYFLYTPSLLPHEVRLVVEVGRRINRSAIPTHHLWQKPPAAQTPEPSLVVNLHPGPTAPTLYTKQRKSLQPKFTAQRIIGKVHEKYGVLGLASRSRSSSFTVHRRDYLHRIDNYDGGMPTKVSKSVAIFQVFCLLFCRACLISTVTFRANSSCPTGGHGSHASMV